MIRICFLLFLLKTSVDASDIADPIGCRDESGALIDWFYLYKLPNEFEGQESIEKKKNSGMEYLFMTPTSVNKWTMSNRLLNDSNSMPGLTLAPAYGGNTDNFVMMYNDEPPEGQTDGTRGHTKGVLIANDISGFWLVHSVPKYPPPFETHKYNYPSTGTIYGQSFLCMSFTGDQLGKVGNQLKFNEPHFYSSQVPNYLKRIYPELVEALEMKPVTTAPFYNVESLETRQGADFISFAKSRKFQKELYEDLVAPHYESGDFFVETWRHGPGNIDSDCTKPAKVYNIEDINFKNEKIGFKTMKDHSKWMVSEEHKLICVGDINRQEHQKVRGGGTVCQQTKAAIVYSELISEVEKCKKTKKEIKVQMSNNLN